MKYVKLERTHSLLFNLVVTVGVVALAVAEGNPFYLAVTLLAGLVGNIRVGKPPIPNAWGNLSLPFIAAFAVVDYLLVSQSLLLSTVHLLLLIQAVKLLSEKTEREYKLFYFVSLVNLCVAAVLTQTLLFGLVFVVYMVLITASLVLFNLLNQAKQSKDVLNLSLPRSFFFGICSMSAVTLCFTVVLFVLVPRVGYRMFRTALGAVVTTGISSEIDLTESMDILQDETPVAQVKFYGYDEPTDRLLYLRCVVLTHYEGGRWWRASPEILYRHATEEDMIRLHEQRYLCPRSLENERLVFQVLTTSLERKEAESVSVRWRKMVGVRVFLNPTSDFFLPVVGEPNRIEFFSKEAPPDLFASRMGTLYYPTPRKETCGYDMLTSVVREDAPLHTCHTRTRVAGVDYTQLEKESPYFQKERIKELTQKVVRSSNAASPYHSVKALCEYLRENYRYTMRPRRFNYEIDPVSEFLFETKEGHCEYFASALTVMLRSIGIGARVASGYRGGEWNPYGKFYTVRRKDAHCWVEVFLDDDDDASNGSRVGWVVFDATPPYEPPKKGTFSFLADILSYLKMRWMNYVIFYDAARWRQTVSGIAKRGSDVMYEASEWWQSVAGFLQRLSRGVILPLLALLAVSVGLFLILRHIMKEKEGKKGKEEKKRESPSFPAILFYRKMLSLAERRGFIRLPNMTPYELINPLTRFFGTKGCEGVKFVTEMFVKIRYGGGSLQVDEQRRLEETVDTLSSLLRNKKN